MFGVMTIHLYRYFDHWCGDGLQYLDDSKCVKKFPSKFDRDGWSCPIMNNNIPSGFAADMELSKVEVDVSVLGDIITNGASVCAVITKRNSGKLYHKYFCAGEFSRDTAYETWSR